MSHIAIAQAILTSRGWVNLDLRMRCHLSQTGDTACLCARLVLSEKASRCEIERILCIGCLGRILVADSAKACAAARRGKGILKQTPGAGMIFRGAGPENSLLPFNFLVGDAGVVGEPLGTGAAQLIKDLAWRRKREICSFAQPGGQLTEDLAVRAHRNWGSIRSFATDDASLKIRHRPLLLCPLGCG